jgi:hypothetical protein
MVPANVCKSMIRDDSDKQRDSARFLLRRVQYLRSNYGSLPTLTTEQLKSDGAGHVELSKSIDCCDSDRLRVRVRYGHRTDHQGETAY